MIQYVHVAFDLHVCLKAAWKCKKV